MALETSPTLDEREPIDELVALLTLEEKVVLLTGDSAWSSAALPRIGLRRMIISDGPSGVRGEIWDERHPSLSLPSATALSSSWDVELAREYGRAIAFEARRKGVDVVLGPTINLHRSPLGGRHFEAFSEDPVLTAALASAYVEGVQSEGVAAAPKHYVANDFETDRFNADVAVSERALRELYLLAFERAITEARAWLVMSAYNSINGVTATENRLLTDPLTTTWQFDGVVISDWGAVRHLESARHPQDLAMPGPSGPWGEHLVAAVRAGTIDEHVIDEKVRRMLRLAARVGALTGFEPKTVTPIDTLAFARRAATEGMVLVRNDELLPLDAPALTRVAVFGDNATRPRIQGGGSASVMAEHIVTPLAGIRDALPGSVTVDHRVGAYATDGFTAFDPSRMANPITGSAGARISYLDAAGAEIFAEDRFASFIMEMREEIRNRALVTFTTLYTPAATGTMHVGFAAPGTGRLFADGRLVFEATVVEEMDEIQGFFSPPSATAPLEVVGGVPVELRYEFAPSTIVDGVAGSVFVTFGTEQRPLTADEGQRLIDEAVESAREADVAIVVVGTNPHDESEGYDRDDLRLPGRQDDLVRAVAAVNPRTVVVVNAGAPIEMPWRDEVASVLLTWFGGQEFGHALADVLFGSEEPGGRLPTTWPKRLEDAPVTAVTPVDGVVTYREGIHIGYKAWLKAGAEPAYAFGHGLGYTSWRIGDAAVAADPSTGGCTVTVDVTNSGTRSGKQVVQVYARRPISAVERPACWLVGFAVVRLDAGEAATVTVSIPRRAFSHWEDGDWQTEPGAYDILVGTSISALADPIVFALA